LEVENRTWVRPLSNIITNTLYYQSLDLKMLLETKFTKLCTYHWAELTVKILVRPGTLLFNARTELATFQLRKFDFTILGNFKCNFKAKVNFSILLTQTKWRKNEAQMRQTKLLLFWKERWMPFCVNKLTRKSANQRLSSPWAYLTKQLYK